MIILNNNSRQTVLDLSSQKELHTDSKTSPQI